MVYTQASEPRTGHRRHYPERRRWRRPSAATWCLLSILTVQAGLSLRLVWSNTAYMDEALYLRFGHLEIAHWLHGSPVPPSSFSGAPVIYPPLGALADSLGGLAGARLLSLAFMLGATGLLYATAFRIFGRSAAIVAAAVFAALGTVQFLGALATFDAMSVCLTAFAAWLVIRAEGRLSELFLVAAALVMAIADATKFASVLWDPVIIALAVVTTTRGGWMRSAARGMRLALYLAVALALAVFRFGGASYIGAITSSTLDRSADNSVSPSHVLGSAFDFIGIIFLLAALGTAISFTRRPWRDRFICVILTVAVVLAPVHQAQIPTLTSLQKHVVFGAWFAAIPAGYALTQLIKLLQSTTRITATTTTAMILSELACVITGFIPIIGIYQSTALFKYWPNQSRTIRVVAAVVREDPGPCLLAENDIFSYYLPSEIRYPETTCGGSYGFWNPVQKQYETSDAAFVAAIRGHYFTVIEADQDENGSFYAPVVAAASAAGYSLVASLPDSTGSDPIKIWRYEPGRAHHTDRRTHRHEAAAAMTTVDVYNGGNTQGLAGQVSAALVKDGYKAGQIGNTSALATTEVFYGTGSAASASQIASLFGVTATASSTVPTGHVEVLLGANATLPAASATLSASSSAIPIPTTGA